MNWIRLTAEQARSLYGIPTEIANVLGNMFYGMRVELPYGYDVPRPLLAFLQSKEHSSVVTLFIKTIHPESMEDDRGLLINPFSFSAGGFLELQKKDLIDLIYILLSYERTLLPNTKRDKQGIKKIENSDIRRYNIHPEWFPNSKQEYYVQIDDPVIRSDDKSIMTIIGISKTAGFQNIFLQIAQFLTQELEDPKFQPMDRGISKINLDNFGIHELVGIFREQIELSV